MNRKWVLLALFAGLAGVFALAAFRKSEARPLRGDWPVNFAHRGASARAPENTIEAFRAGMEDGAKGLELDVHMTRDGQIVVIHDDTVDRTTDGSGLVSEMTLEEIRSLDAGYRTGQGGRRLPVPTLAEVYREFPDAYVNLEIKEDRPGVEEAVLGVIRRAHAEKRTLVASARHGVIERFREVSGGEVATSASRREIRTFFLMSRLRLERLLRPEYVALQVPVGYGNVTIVTPRFIEAAHALGLRVDVWTINDPGEMQRLLDLGADVVMTDRPADLSRVLSRGT